MNLEKNLPKPWYRTRWLWVLIAVVVVIIIIVVVVPLAVLLPRKNHPKTPSAAVILPLYIYPSNDSSWSPLFDALKLNPDLNFTVIVNPNSGPGDTQTPGDQYTPAVEELNSYPNVQTVGYVRTGYATRNISDVINEVNIYSGWFFNSSSLAMHGIFFDEAPHQYTADAVDFMITIDEAVKNATGLQGAKTIIHNPGTVPDPQFNATHPDITVVFEDTYDAWQQKEAQVEALPKTRSAYSLMINSAPEMNNGTLGPFLSSLSDVAEYLFLTTQEQNYYESFADDWLEFVGQMPT